MRIVRAILGSTVTQGKVMGITLAPFVVGDVCDGCSWAIDDLDQLAQQIAFVAVGQSEHLVEILGAAGVPVLDASSSVRANALELLSAAVDSPYHRDGWMFQVMSWLAAHRRTPGGLIRTPHMIKAHKGFDGLQVNISDSSGAVDAVVIFEDKATENPRDVIRDEVWPEFADLEGGGREHVLAAEVTTLLKIAGHSNASSTVKKIMWGSARNYRVSVTVGAHHYTVPGIQSLLAGFDGVAPGERSRRRGEILYVEALRPWLHDLAELAKNKITAG